MKQLPSSRLVHCAGLLLVALLWLANSANPPTGRTGAPFDGNCNQCHSPSSALDGNVTISGMPTTVMPNVVYPLQITMDATTGNPAKGGFQLVVVDGNNANAGNLIAGNAQSGTETSSGRKYLEHRGAKVFSNGSVSWDFSWTAPATASGNSIKFYFIGNFVNGNNNDSGDHPVAASETYTFASAPSVVATITNTTNVNCNGGNDGSATATASGGTPPYTYLWSNGQTIQTANNLAAGNYMVTVTATGGGTAIAMASITQPAALFVNTNVNGTISCAQTSVNVTASVTGGTGPYSYEWSNGATNNPASYTVGGAQSVTVTDANGCTKVSSFTIQGSANPPNATVVNSVVLTCTQPTAVLNGNGSSTGTNITYSWTASNGGNIVSGATTLMPTVNAAGNYTLIVTDNSSGCTAAANTTLTANVAPPNVTAIGGIINCSQATTTIHASSSTSGATFAWSGPNVSSNQPTVIVSNAGTYTVTVTNPANGCTNTATAVVTQNNPPTVTLTNGVVNCSNPAIPLTLSTNASQPTFLWAGPCINSTNQNQQSPVVTCGGNYTVTVTNTVNGCTSSSTVSVLESTVAPTLTATADGPLTCGDNAVMLAANTNATNPVFLWSGPGVVNANTPAINVQLAGNYNVTVTSPGSGCTATATVIVIQNTTSPTASIAAPGSLNCNNTTLQLNAAASSQGTNFTYQWTTNGNIVAGANTLTPTVNAAGTYTLTVTNTINGCTASTSVNVTQSTPVNATITNVIPVTCNGGINGSATANAIGGTGTYTFVWSNGATTAGISNLSAGTYTVTVADGANCTATVSTVINQPQTVLANASATAQTVIGVNNGTATATPSGGNGGYIYSWSNTATTANITALAPGSYTVTVTDGNGCRAVQTVTVNSVDCNVTAGIATGQITCNGAANGTATINLMGATLPATYLWSNSATTAFINGLGPGNYTVSITDANGCPVVANALISEPALLAANATSTAITAVNATDGQATAQPTGGTAPYTYLWSNNATTASINSLAPGDYTVTVTDGNNCTAVQTVSVNAFNCALLTSVTVSPATCPGSTDGAATLQVAGGSSPYTYIWSNGSTLATTVDLAAGIYTVTVTDAASCSSTATATIVASDNIAPTLTCPADIFLCGANIVTYSSPVLTDNCSLTGNISTLISGQASGSAFDDGVTTQVFSATDAAGNTTTCSFSITVFPPPDILVDSIHNDSGNSGIGSIYITAVGGVGPYTFTWRKDFVFFSNAEDLTGLQAGSYMLSITDANGCGGALAPVFIDNVVGTKDPSSTTSIRVWPNPAQTGIWVKMNGLEAFSAQILNTQGRLVQTISPVDLADFLSVESLPNGVYYLKIMDGTGKTWVVKWVKGG